MRESCSRLTRTCEKGFEILCRRRCSPRSLHGCDARPVSLAGVRRLSSDQAVFVNRRFRVRGRGPMICRDSIFFRKGILTMTLVKLGSRSGTSFTGSWRRAGPTPQSSEFGNTESVGAERSRVEPAIVSWVRSCGIASVIDGDRPADLKEAVLYFLLEPGLREPVADARRSP